ncbi:MAG TPA: MMPL family transporter [Polyangiaceae bacterium]|nr:MMPL family transporter [Polyangiaceae bacterium]
MLTAYLRWLLRHRAMMAGILCLSIGLSLASARRIRFQFQFRDFFDYPANVDLPLFRQDNEEFGDPAGNVVVLIEANDLWRPAVLDYVTDITRTLATDAIFSRVQSITTASGIYADGDEVVTGQLLRADADPGRLERVKAYLAQSPLFLRRLLSRDGKATGILAEMRTPATFASVDEQAQAVAAARRAIAKRSPPPGARVTITGAPLVETETTSSLLRDQLTLLPGVILVIVLALLWTFRALHGVLLAISAVTVALIWTTGIFGTFGRPVDILASVIPTTLLVYGVVDPIFVLTRFLEKLDAGRLREDAILESFQELGLPCFVTSLTTAVGFASFVLADAPTVRYYGLTVAIGVLAAWATTMSVLPLLLASVKLPAKRHSALSVTHGIMALLAGTWARVRPRPGLVVLVACTLLIAAGALASRQLVSNQYVGGLPRGQVQDDVRRLEQRLSGVIRLIVHLEGAPGSISQPAALAAMANVQRSIAADPLVTSTTSLADYVAEANQAFSGGDAAMRQVPRSPALVAQYLTLTDLADKAPFVNGDESKAHIAVLVADHGSAASRALAERLKAAVAEARFEALGLEATVTGNGIVAYRELDHVVHVLLWGFVSAFTMILLIEAVLFRSLRLALLTLLPNLLPVAVCFLVVRALGKPLKIENTLVASISIGGLFNTTIHLVARVAQQVKSGETEIDLAISRALSSVGPASLYTAAILSLGFAVLGLSRFPGLQTLGLLSAVTLVLGFFADVTVTPALLKLLVRPRLQPGVAHLEEVAP